MKRIRIFILILICAALTAPPATAGGDKNKDKHYNYAMRLFQHSPVVKPYFENAYGFAIFPTVGKGGFWIGAAYGGGRVYRRGTQTGTSELVQLSLGLQMGGQAFSEIIFFQDKRAYEEFTSGKFEFDASASVVAITAGAQASASTTGNSAGASAGPATAVQAKTNYHKGMATFIQTKGGLMYQAAIGGQKFNFKPL